MGNGNVTEVAMRTIQAGEMILKLLKSIQGISLSLAREEFVSSRRIHIRCGYCGRKTCSRSEAAYVL